jgi:hypothetical protein
MNGIDHRGHRGSEDGEGPWSRSQDMAEEQS